MLPGLLPFFPARTLIGELCTQMGMEESQKMLNPNLPTIQKTVSIVICARLSQSLKFCNFVKLIPPAIKDPDQVSTFFLNRSASTML